MRRLPRGFGLLLRILPGRFRARHEREIRASIGDWISEAPLPRRVGFWLRAALDIVVVGVGLRLEAARRSTRGESMRIGIVRDLRFAWRALARRPGFTLVVVGTLAIGIGANVAMFSVLHGVLLKPLPYADSERIGIVWHRFGETAQSLPHVHALDAHDYRDRATLFEALTVATGGESIVGTDDDAELVDIARVEHGFLEFFGAEPQIGRGFRPEDDVPGAAPVVVLGHRLWRQRFGSDPDVVGQTLDVGGESARVVGVAPAWFRLHLPSESVLLRDPDLFLALRLDPAAQRPRNVTFFTAFVRVRDGVSLEAAQQELDVLAAGLRSEHAVHAAANLRARLVPLHDDVVRGAETTLVSLMAAVGFVLLIACANVAGLVIVRGQDRGSELAVRAALGAGRSGLVRLVVAESALLALGGAVAGTLLARGALTAMAARWSAIVPRLETVVLDGTALGFLLATTALTTLLFGMPAALRCTRLTPADVLAAEGRTGPDRRRRRLRDTLVVLQVAGSLVLLVAAGLMLRTAGALLAVDPGFAVQGGLTFRVSLPEGAFPDPPSRIAFRTLLAEELAALPGVERAGAINQLPLTGAGGVMPYAYDEATASNWESASADGRFVAPGYFAAIGARLRSGRELVEDDYTAGNPLIIDDTLAARAFPDGDAVGQRLQVAPTEAPEAQRWGVVVGVVEHLRIHSLAASVRPQIYRPMRSSASFSVVLRTTGDQDAVLAAARSTLARLAPGAPFQDVRTFGELAAESLGATRMTLVLLAGFGVVALLLASLGLYGVLAEAVSGRTREIGVRMALGQSPAAVRRLVLGEGVRLTAVAVVLGLGGAALTSQAIAGLTYGVDPLDPITYGVTTVCLGVVALAACWIPARRATRVDPAVALRG